MNLRVPMEFLDGPMGSPMLFFEAKTQLLLLLGDAQLTPIARVPDWLTSVGFQRRVLLTNRFIYARTSHGILRIERKAAKH